MKLSNILINKMRITFHEENIFKDFDILKITADTPKESTEEIYQKNKRVIRNHLYEFMHNTKAVISFHVSEESRQKIEVYALAFKCENAFSRLMNERDINPSNYENIFIQKVNMQDAIPSFRILESVGNFGLKSDTIDRSKDCRTLAWHIFILFSQLAWRFERETQTFLPNYGMNCVYPIEGIREFTSKTECKEKKEKYKIIKMSKVSIDRDLTLNIEQKTFMTYAAWKERKKDEPKRAFSVQCVGPDDREMLCAIPASLINTNNQFDIFVEGTSSKFKNTKTFNDFWDINKFYDSKCGILLSFLDEMSNLFSNYFTICFPLIETFNSTKTDKIHFKQHRYARLKRIAQKGIHILGGEYYSSQSFSTEEDFKKLCKSISDYFVTSNKELGHKFPQFRPPKITGFSNGRLSTKTKKDQFNLCIVKDTDFYEKNAITDDYTHSDPNIIIQHVFDKNISSLSSASIDMLIKQLTIKDDIVNGNISEENDAPGGKNQYIVIAEQSSKEKDENGKKIPRIYVLIKFPDGSLKFGKFTRFYSDSDFDNFPFSLELQTAIREKLYDSDLLRKDEYFNTTEEYIVGFFKDPKYLISPINFTTNSYTSNVIKENLFVVYSTKYIPIPNLLHIRDISNMANEKRVLDISTMIEIVKSNKEITDENDRMSFIEELSNMKSSCSALTVKKYKKIIMKQRKGKPNHSEEKILIESDRLYELFTGYSISSINRVKSDKASKFTNITGINTKRAGNYIYFYAGLKSQSSLKYSIPKAIRIKAIYDPLHKLDEKDIVNLLLTDCVKAKEENTVKVYLDKFLREYRLYCEKPFELKQRENKRLKKLNENY